MNSDADLKFDNANNAAMSLHCLAEFVRKGDARVSMTDTRADGRDDVLIIYVKTPKMRR